MRRFTPRTTATADVKVYSNLGTVTLSVNGTVIAAPVADGHRFRWTAIPLEIGDNRLEVVATDSAGRMATDTVIWTRQ